MNLQLKKDKKINKSNNLRINTKYTFYVIKNAYFFVMFALLNTIFPVILCIILSYIPNIGLQSIIGIGRVSYFTFSFAQLGVTFSLSVNFLIAKFLLSTKRLDGQNKYNLVIYNAIIYSFIVSLFLIIVYTGASYLYLNYSCNSANTYIAFNQGINYVYSSDPYIYFLCFMDILILYIYERQKNVAIYFVSIFYILSYVLTYLLSVYANLSGIWAGLSLTISCIFVICLMIFYIYVFLPIKINFKKDIYLKKILKIKGLIREAVSGICTNLFRGIGLLIISFSIFSYQKDHIVPLSYNLAIIFLLNYMYLISFAGIGLSDVIKYYHIYYPIENRSHNPNIFWRMAIFSLIISAIITYICSILTIPLATLYSQNNKYISPLEIPALPTGMPYSIHNNLPPIKFPLIPQNITDPKTQIHKLLEDYINGTINNPLSYPHLYEWYIWFKNNSPELNQWILNHPNEFVSWLKEYEYYASCNPEVVNAFINLRSSYQINHPNEYELLISQLQFNAKTMIYIGVFGCCYSLYYIFSAANTALSKKDLPIILIILGSFITITFIMSFGASFNIFLGNDKHNYFKNLDAFSFPLMIASILLSLVSFVGYVLSIKKWEIKKEFFIKNKKLKEIKIINESDNIKE